MEPRLATPETLDTHIPRRTLLNLPPELREAIYGFLVADEAYYAARQIPIENRSGAGIFNHPGYIVTQVCRLIRAEALPSYLNHHIFKFYLDAPYLKATLRWLDIMQPDMLACLRRVALEDYQRYGGKGNHRHGRCYSQIRVDFNHAAQEDPKALRQVLDIGCRDCALIKQQYPVRMVATLRRMKLDEGKIVVTEKGLLKLFKAANETDRDLETELKKLNPTVYGQTRAA